jgi:hypothetical protein
MAPSCPLPWRVLSAPKRGHTADENEDAWAANPEWRRFAVADGASEASWSGLWARLVTEAFVAHRQPWVDASWLDEPRQSWSSQVDSLDLSWYAEMKRAQGAYAAFLGLALRLPTPDEPGRWRALAIGDSCLLRIRPGHPPRAFPLTSSAQFGNQPHLLGSRPSGAPAFVHDRGSCLPGDRLYLLTDAVAQWFLHCCENDGQPWDDLDRLFGDSEGSAPFSDWIDARRERNELRNDDVTVLAVGPIPHPTTE